MATDWALNEPLVLAEGSSVAGVRCSHRALTRFAIATFTLAIPVALECGPIGALLGVRRFTQESRLTLASTARGDTFSGKNREAQFKEELFDTWSGILVLFFLVSGWCFALVLLLPCCRFRSWPNSYIADAATVAEDSGSSIAAFKARTRAVAGLLVAWCADSWSRHPLARRPSFLSCIGEEGEGRPDHNLVHDEARLNSKGQEGFGTLQQLHPSVADDPNSRTKGWSPGPGTGLEMRCGPNYPRFKKKQEATGHMYECISVEILRANHKIESIFENGVMPVPPHRQIGSGVLSWAEGCALPRIICINVQLPYSGANPFGLHDPGCSMVALFHITSETLQKLEDRHCDERCLKLFKRFWEGPEGCLDNRLTGRKKSNMLGGLFKAVAFCRNLANCTEGMPMADVARKMNGKPCLITKSGNLLKGPLGEWMEVSVDVRLFATLARVMLAKFRERVAMATIHVGFFIQGADDDELPEGLIGDTMLHNVHIVEDARDIQN